MLKSNPLQVEKRPSIDRGFTGLECDFHECPFYCVAELTGAQTLDVCLGRRLFSHETAIKRWPIVRRITSLLSRVHQGDSEALNTLIPLLYEELKRLAASHLRRENANATIQTAALVHEAFLLPECLPPERWAKATRWPLARLWKARHRTAASSSASCRIRPLPGCRRKQLRVLRLSSSWLGRAGRGNYDDRSTQSTQVPDSRITTRAVQLR